MNVGRLKKLGVLTLMLIPLSLSGCKKEGSVDEGLEGDNVAIDSGVGEEQVVQEPISEPTPPSIDLDFANVEDRDLPKDAELHFIPVGLGESVLFRDGSDYALIDAGGKKGATLSYLKKVGVPKLKYLVLTQWDNDSITDVEGILDTFQVDYIIAPEIQSTAHKKASAVRKSLEDKGLHISEPKKTKVEYKIGNSSFSLLNRVAKNNIEDDNALGVYIDIGGTKVYISSDASTNQEEVKELGDIDIYSVARHGDSSINTAERINILKPEYSIIPTDGITIDYSDTEALLKSVGSKVDKTTDGVIVYKITDKGIEVKKGV